MLGAARRAVKRVPLPVADHLTCDPLPRLAPRRWRDRQAQWIGVTNIEPKEDRRILGAVTAAYTVGVLGGNMQPLVIGALIDSLGMDAGDAGLLGSIELVSVAVASFILAPRMAAISRRTSIVTGAALAAVGYLGSTLVQSFLALAAYRVIAVFRHSSQLSTTLRPQRVSQERSSRLTPYASGPAGRSASCLAETITLGS